MSYQVIRESGKSYVEWIPGACIANEHDALEMVAACGECDTNRLMLQAENLTPEFFQLRTGVAGGILLNLTNYTIKAALVLKPEQVGEGKFKEWVLETNRGREFRVFYDRARAE